MKTGNLEELIKKLPLLLMVFGGALAALGLSGHHRWGWDWPERIEIAIGVGLFLLGIFLRKER